MPLASDKSPHESTVCTTKLRFDDDIIKCMNISQVLFIDLSILIAVQKQHGALHYVGTEAGN